MVPDIRRQREERGARRDLRACPGLRVRVVIERARVRREDVVNSLDGADVENIRKNSSGHSSPANYVAVDSRCSWYSLAGKYIAAVADIAPCQNYVRLYGFGPQIWGTTLCTAVTMIAIMQYFFSQNQLFNPHLQYCQWL
jgi:hypothetical protein